MPMSFGPKEVGDDADSAWLCGMTGKSDFTGLIIVRVPIPSSGGRFSSSHCSKPCSRACGRGSVSAVPYLAGLVIGCVFVAIAHVYCNSCSADSCILYSPHECLGVSAGLVRGFFVGGAGSASAGPLPFSLDYTAGR